MKLKHYGSEYPKHKRSHGALLRAAQVMPLTGDGLRARQVNRPYADPRWMKARLGMPTSLADQRARLVEARYLDWLDERNVALSPFAAVVTLLGQEG